MKRITLISLFFLLFGSRYSYGQTATIPIYVCQNAGVKAVISGASSSNYMEGVIPACTVTVYFTGTTTKATIYKDSSGTTQNNPFTALSNGVIQPTYAAVNQGYDVVLSAGIPPNIYITPLTLTGLYPGTNITITSGITQLTGDVTAGPGTGSVSATVARLKNVPFCTGFTPTNGQAIEYTTVSSPNPCYTASSIGSVTSVSFTGASPLFSCSVASPSGAASITCLVSNASANMIYAGPSSGASAAGAFRSLVSGDIPQLPNANLANPSTTVNGQTCVLGSSCTVTAVATSAPFSGLTTSTNTTASLTVGSGSSLAASGTGTIAATSAPYSGLTGTVPTWNQNTTGTAASLSGASTYSIYGANSSTTPAWTQTITLGTPGYSDSGVSEQYTRSVAGYFQNILQNTSNATNASADLIVQSNLGTATTYYGDFGMNSSTFSGSGSLNLPNATFLTATSGDLSLGTTTANAVHILANGALTDAITVSSANVPTLNNPVVSGNLPVASGALTGLTTNGILNTDLFATGTNGSGNNGVTNAMASTTYCSSGCTSYTPPTSVTTENLWADITKTQSRVIDNRYGAHVEWVYNPSPATSLNVYNWEINSFENAQPSVNARHTTSMYLNDNYATPGEYVGGPWSVHVASTITANAYTRSISQAFGTVRDAYHVGDSGDYWYVNCRGGEIATSDEGCVGLTVQIQQPLAPSGTITTGGASATSVKMNMTANSGNQGETGYAISTTEQMSIGLITASAPGVQSTNVLAQVTTSDTHAVSTAMGTLNSACGANVVRNAPVSYTCTVTLTGPESVLGNFATGTGALGDVCVGDWRYPEQAQLTAVGTAGTTQTLTMLLAYTHPANTPIYQGGMCGGKLALGEGFADPTNQDSTRQFTQYFIAGSQTSTSLDYVIVYKGGQNGLPSINMSSITGPSLTVTSASSTAGVVTAVVPANLYRNAGLIANNTLPTASTIQYLGGSNSSMNGVISSFTYGGDSAPTTAGWTMSGSYTGTSTGGTVSIVGFNNYIAYCGAEIVALGNTSVSQPNGDGTFKLEANHCNWPVTSAMITPDHYVQNFASNHDVYTAHTPPISNANAIYSPIISGLGLADANTFAITTSDPLSMYTGYGNSNQIASGHTTIYETDYINAWLNLKYGPLNGGVVFSIGRPPAGGSTQNYTLFQLFGATGGGFPGTEVMYNTTTNLLSFTNGSLSVDGGVSNGKTIAVGDNSTQVPTTAFMNTAISNARSGVLNSATLTNATPVTSATCLGTCTSSRGYIAVVGGTQTTGTFLTLTWTATPTTFCSVTQEGGTTWLGLDRSGVSTTGVAFTSANTISGVSFNLSYECTP